MKDCFRNSCDFFVCVLIYSVVWSCLVGFHIITISLQEGERLSLLYKVALNGWRLSPQTIHGPEGSKCPIISCNKRLRYFAPTQFCTRPTAVPIRGCNVHKSIANFMAMIGERHGAAMCRTTSCPGRVCVKKSCIGITRSLRRIKMQRRPLCFHDMEIYCPETSSAAGYAPKQRYVHHMNINVYNSWYEKCRLESCPKIYTTGFFCQKFYILKVRELRLFLLKKKQRKCIYLVAFPLKFNWVCKI